MPANPQWPEPTGPNRARWRFAIARYYPPRAAAVYSRIRDDLAGEHDTDRLRLWGHAREPTMAKLIHAMLRVLEEARSVEFYARAFALAVADRYEFPDFTLLYLRNDATPFELELTINHGRTAPYAPGDGYGHLAVSVGDLALEHRRMTEAGLAPTPIRELVRNGRMLARFFFLQDPDGYRIEVLQRQGRYL